MSVFLALASGFTDSKTLGNIWHFGAALGPRGFLKNSSASPLRWNLNATHQHPLYPSELDHSFGVGWFFCRSLLGRGQLLAIGETIFKWLLNKINIALGQNKTAARDIQEPSQMEKWEQEKAMQIQLQQLALATAEGGVTIQTMCY